MTGGRDADSGEPEPIRYVDKRRIDPDTGWVRSSPARVSGSGRRGGSADSASNPGTSNPGASNPAGADRARSEKVGSNTAGSNTAGSASAASDASDGASGRSGAGAARPGAGRSGRASGSERSAEPSPTPESTEAESAAPEEPAVETASTEAPVETADESTGDPATTAPAAADAAEVGELMADLKRMTAEYANYRRRAERERSAAADGAKVAVVRQFLPVLDDLDRARRHGDLEAGPLRALSDKLNAVFEGLGLVAFGAEGDPFDPELHEAVQHEGDGSNPVLGVVMRHGYRLGDRLVRTAMVGVVDAPAAENA